MSFISFISDTFVFIFCAAIFWLISYAIFKFAHKKKFIYSVILPKRKFELDEISYSKQYKHNKSSFYLMISLGTIIGMLTIGMCIAGFSYIYNPYAASFPIGFVIGIFCGFNEKREEEWLIDNGINISEKNGCTDIIQKEALSELEIKQSCENRINSEEQDPLCMSETKLSAVSTKIKANITGEGKSNPLGKSLASVQDTTFYQEENPNRKILMSNNRSLKDQRLPENHVYCHMCGVLLPACAVYCNRCGTMLISTKQENKE